MKLLLVAPCFPPLQAVASLRTHAFAAAWADAGHAVTVLTTAKRADQGSLELPRDGFRVVELAYPVPWFLERLRGQHRAEQAAEDQPRRGWFGLLRRLQRQTGIFSAARMPDLTDFWVEPAVTWASAQTWDVVVSSSGPPAAHLVARALKRGGVAPRWAADFRDLWTDNHLYRGLFPFTLRERFEEAACLREADLLVTVTEGLADKLAARAGKPVTVIYNGYDSPALRPEPAFPADGRVRLVYTGTLYPQGQDPTPLLRALQQLPNLLLVVAGPGGEQWRALARRHDILERVEVRGPLPRPEALRLQRDADALVLLDWHDAGQGVLTGKLFEYLRAPGPILVIGGQVDSPVARLVAATGRGLHVGADVERIRAALADLRSLVGPVNVRLLETLSRPRQSLRLLAQLEGLHNRTHRAA